MDDKLGTFEKGKQPGVILLQGVDLKQNEKFAFCKSAKIDVILKIEF